MTLRLKILLYIVLSITVIFIVSVGLVNYRYTVLMINMAQKIADMYTEQSAGTAESILESDMKSSEGLKNFIIVLRKVPKEKQIEYLSAVLTNSLQNNPEFLSVWASLELNAFDTTWHYPYGRVRVIAFWDKGIVRITKDTVDIDGDNYGSEYYKMKSGFVIHLLTNPYIFSYTKDTATTYLESSIGTGIWVNKKFIGAIGVDIAMDRFSNILKKIKPFENSKIMIIANDGTIVAHSDQNLVRKNIKNIYGEFFNFSILKKIQNGENFSAKITKDKQKYYVSFYPIRLEDSKRPWSLGFFVPTNIILKNVYRNTRLSILVSFTGLFIIAIILWLALTQIINPLEKATKSLEELSKGNLDESLKIKIRRRDELGIMAFAVNKLIDALRKTAEFATNIGHGNLDATYNLLGKNDKLGKALLEMKENLLKTREQEEKQKAESKKLSWQQTGLAELNEILRLKSENIETLAIEVLIFIIKYLNANQGGFYVIEEHESKTLIVMKAAYAFDRKKQMTAEIEFGEGIIGRVVKEKTIIHLTDLPEGYVYITSGLGDATPQNLISLPFVFEENVFGAIEILSFYPFEDYQIEFLKQAAERIASTISIIQKNIETQKLLKQLQLQTATFEMKEKQFARLNRRLKQMQTDLELKAVEIELIFNAFSMLASVIELDEKKKIRSVNSHLPEALDILPDELLGKDISEIQKQRHGEKWLENFWNDIFNGVVRRKNTIYFYKNKEHRFEEVYIPVFDKNKKLKKIVVIGLG